MASINNLTTTFTFTLDDSPEAPAQRVARLRAELAEAEEEIAREGAPAGFTWSGEGQGLELSGSEADNKFTIGFTGSRTPWVFVRRTPARGSYQIAPVPFEPLAAFVDRVRRDRGEATPEVAAPVSEAPAASQGIPEGWTAGSDRDGPTLTSEGDSAIYLDSEGSITVYERDDLITRDAMRAFLVLCDK